MVALVFLLEIFIAICCFSVAIHFAVCLNKNRPRRSRKPLDGPKHQILSRRILMPDSQSTAEKANLTRAAVRDSAALAQPVVIRMTSPKPLPNINKINLARFWSRIDKSSGPDSCWPWRGTKTAAGYGVFFADGKSHSATRLLYLLTHGVDPGPLLIRHICDNPPCCNPSHHLTGNHKDNSRDAVERGRIASGDRNGSRTHPEKRALGSANFHSKIGDEMAVDVRYRYASGQSCASIADELGVQGSIIQRIVRGEAYRHVGGPIVNGKLTPMGERGGHSLITREIGQQIINWRAEGKTVRWICEQVCVTQGAVWPLLRGDTWPDLDRSSLGGSYRPKRHLTVDQREDIRKKRAEGIAASQLAEEYGMALSAIYYIIHSGEGGRF